MDKVKTPHLLQSKSYLKIISLLYLMENMNIPITLDVVEKILKSNHIFNNILIASWPRIIKVFPKSDIAIIWLNIWDFQSSMNTRGLINRCFNVSSFITTVPGANMNLGIPQCKKCWKWSYSTHSCRVQDSKYVKCNGPHLTKYHWQFSWSCKANSKTNPPRLETKQENHVLIPLGA